MHSDLIIKSLLSYKKSDISPLLREIETVSSFKSCLHIMMKYAEEVYKENYSVDLLNSLDDEDSLFSILGQILVEYPSELSYFLSLITSREIAIKYYFILNEIFYYLHKTIFQNKNIIIQIIEHPIVGCFFSLYSPQHFNCVYYKIKYNKTEEEVDKIYLSILNIYMSRWATEPGILFGKNSLTGRKWSSCSYTNLNNKCLELFDGILFRDFNPDELIECKKYLRNIS